MKIGIILPQWSNSLAGATPTAPDVVQFGRNAEALGIDSLWLFDHIYYEPYLDFLEHGFQMPDEFKGIRVGSWECWTTLAALSLATSEVELGTMVTNTAFRNPALLANMAETADSLSNGRVTLGLGAGDFRSEHSFHGFPWDRRVSRFEEALQIIVPMLNGEQVTFEGEFYQAENVALLPRGPRPNGLSVMIGVMQCGPRMLRLVAEYADEWNSWLAFGDSHPAHFAERLHLVDQACDRHNRDRETLRDNVTVGLTMPGYEGLVPGASPLSGSPQDVATEIQEYAELGVDHLTIFLQPYSDESMEWLQAILHHVPGRSSAGHWSNGPLLVSGD